MVRFAQTSDWQIGMKGGGLGEAGPIVREARIRSIENVLKAAQENEADFLLLCGDIFEHNMVSQEDVKKVVTIFNQYPDVPLYLLPGNHDILGADCVYNREIFQRIKHLKILRTSDPVEVPGALLHPCPVFSKSVSGYWNLADPCTSAALISRRSWRSTTGNAGVCSRPRRNRIAPAAGGRP